MIAAMVERARMRGDMVSARGLVGWLGRRCVVIAAMVERAWGASVVVLARRGCRCVMCAAAFGRVGAIRRGCRCVMCAARFAMVMVRSVVMLARCVCSRCWQARDCPGGCEGRVQCEGDTEEDKCEN